MSDTQITAEELYESRFGNPVVFLGAFMGMAARPDRYKIGFDAETLEWIGRVWAEAAMAAIGSTRVYDACLREAQRYAFLAKQLKDGALECGQDGVAILDARADWPHKETLKGAIRALAHAQIAAVQ